ncbi:MAG: Flp pilus assembly complex ATPase component TadA [Candidatus Spechtbacteria bacterium]|nr:Flp pilus assembly complex ATPase component TadA [Candidatus Spechtbacteria bacterium]
MLIDDKRLMAFLLDANIADQKQLDSVLQKAEKAGKPFADELLAENIVSEEQLMKLESYILGIPFVDLSGEKIDPEVLKIIPEPIARKNQIVSFRKQGSELEVAMIDPEDLQTIDFIRKKASLKILPRLTSHASITHALGQYQESLETEFTDLIQKDSTKILETVTKEGEEVQPGDLQKKAEELPVIRIVDSILRHAVSQSASDIHIEPTEKDVIVRYRIDGILHDAMILPRQVRTGIVARIKVLSNLKLDESRLPQDGRFMIQSEEFRVSFRVSVLPVYDGEKLVMRVLREDVKGLTLEEIGLRGEALERIQRNIHKPVGMFLVTGPTGSGKTTTLYTVIDILNTPDVNISTIEDPIEYRMPRVNQTQVRPEIGLTFASGLRSLVRQDPNILMVGEIRDDETANLAINAALTGHLVLSTLHTNSAAGALPRLIDMGQEPFLIASTVNVIIGQRLVRRLCESREKYKLSKKELTTLKKEIDTDRLLAILKQEKIVEPNTQWEDVMFYRPKPMEDCQDGYRGRIGIYEVLEAGEVIKKLIMESASSDQIEEQAKKDGMLTMLEDGLMKAVQGITSIEEVLRVMRE